ncbi:MAG: T9SS type A sorting domain-containing protein [Bacteroidetes bacterium]|nr:T9SS type A sorting domain-containing protein [Bacteroidota bacterium]
MKKRIVLSLLLTLGVSYMFAQGNWFQKNDFGAIGRYGAIGFSIGTKGYIGTGAGAVFYNDFWEWDQGTDVWTQKADYPLTVGASLAFAFGNKGYVGVGTDGANSNKFLYEYDPATNAWTQKSDYAAKIQLGFAFLIANKAYFGAGFDGANRKDFWEYDPVTDTWTQKADIASIRMRAVGFAIANKGYAGTGAEGATVYDDFYEYDPGKNTWTQKASFGGGARHSACGFSIGNKGYIMCGQVGPFVDVWEYDPSTDNWTMVIDFKGGPRELAASYVIGNLAYVVTGRSGAAFPTDVWEFNPLAPGFIQHPKDTLACAGGTITLSAQGYGGTLEYKWQKDGVDVSSFSTDSFLIINPTTGASYGSYRCVLKNAYAYDTSDAAMLNISAGTPEIIQQPKERYGCVNFTAILNISTQSNSPVYYQWYKDGKLIAGATDSIYTIAMVKAADTGYYSCEVTNVCGVKLSDSAMVHYSKVPAKPTITQDWSQLTCVQNYAAYQWLKYNTPIAGATNKTYIIKEKAKYSVEITDDNGCKRKSDELLFTPSSIFENIQQIAKIYPNPNNGSFTLILTTSQQVDIKIINLLGDLVHEENNVDGANYSRHFDLNDVDNGIYFIQVKGENFNYTDRIFIQK